MNENEPMIEEETHLLDYWEVIWKQRKLIGFIVFVGVLTTALYSLSVENIYQANVVITPVSDQKIANVGLSSFVQEFGGLPGLSLPGSASETEIVNLLNSKILRKKILEKYKLLSVFFHEDWDVEKKEWKNKDDAPTIWAGLRALNGIVTVKNSSKENTITIFVDYHDAEMAVKIADFFLVALNEHMSNESKKVAETNRKYLESQLNNTADPLIRQKIYNLIAQQIETGMMAGMKENFAFKVIDPPMVPDRKIRPNRRRMVMLSFVVLLIGGIFSSFLLEYVEKGRSSEKKNA